LIADSAVEKIDSLGLAGFLENGAAAPSDLIDEALTAIRVHLNMPIGYLSEFTGDQIIFRSVSAPGLEHLIKPGDQWPLSQVYCPRVLDGTLPNLIPDTHDVPFCRTLEVTESVPIRSHVSLPIHRSDGSAYGMFCCLSPEPNKSLNQRDLAVMQTFANLAARQVRLIEAQEANLQRSVDQVRRILDSGAFSSVYQPLYSLETGRISGLEALTRFRSDPYRSPDKWFKEAGIAGLEIDLEEATFRLALRALAALPEDVYLSMNASPALVCDRRFDRLLDGVPLHRMVLEITEHHDAHNHEPFFRRLSACRLQGMRVAIDDVGAGYSGLQRIANVAPDLLKLDRSIIHGIDKSPTHRAIVAALRHFAGETGALLLAEGVETEAEAHIVKSLGVGLAQGWYFGKPVPITELDLGKKVDVAA
jgi:EAL domain-containing protein (putative c-di-GMP-specific phosphodiesterase class I)